MPGYENLRTERAAGGVMIATLNRPRQTNALTLSMFGELQRLADEVADDDQVQALVPS